MKTNELHAKSIVELNQELASLLRELFNLRMQRGSGAKPRPSSFKDVRRNIARIKTILREKLEKK
jgi:large subunit ribosomal protein L29